jgi:hypothetical protein
MVDDKHRREHQEWLAKLLKDKLDTMALHPAKFNPELELTLAAHRPKPN